MQLQLIRHLWGVTESWSTAFPKFKATGYTGIEAAILWSNDAQKAELRRLVTEHGFDLVIQVFTGNDCAPGPRTAAGDLASLERQIEGAKTYGPIFLNAHSGHDGWDLDEALRFYDGALALERKHGLRITHELHRGRYFMNARDTAAVLRRLDVKITADFSHWVCVAENLLESEDKQEAIRLAAKNTWHIHARVGHPEGPQVPDPRAPEYADSVAHHEKWWDLVWDFQAARSQPVSTLTPEFGPPGYLWTLPYTRAPLADLAEICDWQAKRQAARFAARPAKAAAAAR